MPQYNKAEVGRIAQQFGFVCDTFEKVLRLKEILKYFNEQEYLKDHLLLTDIPIIIFIPEARKELTGLRTAAELL